MSNDKLAQALRAERDLRILGQQPDVHWESLRDLRRAVYTATDAALAAHEAEKQAVPMTDEADMFWDEDGERNGVEEIVADYYHGDVLKIDRAKRLPSITVRVVGDKGDYEVIEEPAKSSAPPYKEDAECPNWNGKFCGNDGPCHRPHCKPPRAGRAKKEQP